jgi:hypothetical protein
MNDHRFRWRSRTIHIVFSIERIHGERRLILEDVWARTSAIANDVPDWRIEYEACAVAAQYSARHT